MRNLRNLAPLLAGAVALSGCVPTFSQRIGYDRTVANAAGTIAVSDPKLFTREALITERAKDLRWIDQLISEGENPEKIKFQPEIFREIEQIASFAAALGLKFDPAAGLNYRRSQETGDLRQEIDALKLQIQLEQLKRDVELIRGGFADQTAPVNKDIAATTATSPAPAVSASATDQLKTAIDKLTDALTKRLDADGKAAATTRIGSNPFDEFRDRSAYRDMLKSARNAAQLDQIHDAGNNRLIRLNFQASVIPTEKFRGSLGVVQMAIDQPPNSGPSRQLLNDWTNDINRDARFRNGAKLKVEKEPVRQLLDGGRFEKITIARVDVILPWLTDEAGKPQSPSGILARAKWGEDMTKLFSDAGGYLSGLAVGFDASMAQAVCGDGKEPPGAREVMQAYEVASDRVASFEYYLLADKVARDNDLPSPLEKLPDLSSEAQAARTFLAGLTARMKDHPVCKSQVAGVEQGWSWTALSDLPLPDQNVRIYEVGPREQAQQVSTVARSASSLALAASIAASNPGSGSAGEAAAGYSRQAMGRAEALERLPRVVGYTVGGKSAFGWVLGPHATLDPKGKVLVEQVIKPYDLVVDLSVPNWWRSLTLKVSKAWAPSPETVAGGSISQGDASQEITVPLVASGAEYEAFTEYLLRSQAGKFSISDYSGGPINACAESRLYVRGFNIWRTQRAFLLGEVIGPDKIDVAPDMKGIFLTIPAIKPPPNGNLDKTLHLISPFGSAEIEVEYVDTPSGDACKPKAEPTKPDPDALSIATVSSLDFGVPSSFRITVTGANLGKITAVELKGQPGVVKVVDGKTMTVDFDAQSTSSLVTSDNSPLVFLGKDRKELATRYARITRLKP